MIPKAERLTPEERLERRLQEGRRLQQTFNLDEYQKWHDLTAKTLENVFTATASEYRSFFKGSNMIEPEPWRSRIWDPPAPSPEQRRRSEAVEELREQLVHLDSVLLQLREGELKVPGFLTRHWVSIGGLAGIGALALAAARFLWRGPR